MTIKVTLNTASGKALVKALGLVIDTTEAVDSIAADYLDADGTVDLENFGFMKVREIQSTLAELDAIIKRTSDAVMFPIDLHARTQMLAECLDRARQLAAAIREAATL